jgi:hypothetical protein
LIGAAAFEATAVQFSEIVVSPEATVKLGGVDGMAMGVAKISAQFDPTEFTEHTVIV